MQQEIDALSVKHQAFAKAYVENFGNGTQAYASVYPECSMATAGVEAHRLLQKPAVKALVNLEKKKFMENLKLTKDHVMIKVLRLQKTTEDMGDYTNALKACDMLAKMVGAYQPETQVNVIVNNAQVEQIEGYLFNNKEQP